jgi:LytS/YehU family sensor histidine kinase
MTGRLTVTIRVAADLRSRPFPPLILATLAENAIKHGVFPQNGGEIILSGVLAGSSLEVVLSDDGVGLSANVSGGGLGLANAVERLRVLYGPAGSLELRPNFPHGVRVVVIIPADPK